MYNTFTSKELKTILKTETIYMKYEDIRQAYKAIAQQQKQTKIDLVSVNRQYSKTDDINFYLSLIKLQAAANTQCVASTALILLKHFYENKSIAYGFKKIDETKLQKAMQHLRRFLNQELYETIVEWSKKKDGHNRSFVKIYHQFDSDRKHQRKTVC